MTCLSWLVLMIILGHSSAPGNNNCPQSPDDLSCSNVCSLTQRDITPMPGFHLYRKNSCSFGPSYRMLQNNSTVYSFVHNESLCNIAVVWCVLPNGASGTLTWHLPNYNSVSGTMEFCLCAYDTLIQVSSSNKEGTYQCHGIWSTDDGSISIVSTLQFTNSIYNLNSNDLFSTQVKFTETLCTTISTVDIQNNCSPYSIIKEHFTSVHSMSDSSLSSSTAILITMSTTVHSSTSSTVPPVSVQSSSTVPHYAGIGLLVATNLLTLIALISSCVYIFCQRKKSKFIVTENEQISLQNTSQTEATSHNTETSPTSNNNTNITIGTNIYSSVEDEVDNYHHHHRPPARVASQYEVPLDLLQQAHVPLPPPPPLYATLDDQHDLTLPNPEYITNTATAPNPGYITNIAAKPNPGYSTTVIKEEGEGGERGEGERREELDYSYATVNKFLKKPTEDTEYNKLQHE